MEKELKDDLNKELGLVFQPGLTLEEVRVQLSSHIALLIEKDFNQLLSLLYRIDVNEDKLRKTLDNHPSEDAAALLADLIIERQIQKIKSREEYRSNDETSSQEEKW